MTKESLFKILPLFIVIVFLAVSAAGYFFYQYRQTQTELENIKANPGELQKVSQQENLKTLKDVGRLIDLPSNEDPQIVTIADINKLKDQDFFKKGKNGDKVLIYTKNKKSRNQRDLILK